MVRVPLQDAPPPLQLFRALASTGDAFLLQSADGPRHLARFSAVGFAPASEVRIENREALLDGRPLAGPPTRALSAVAAKHRVPDAEGYAFNGGLVGHYSYDYVGLLEKIPRAGDHDAPDARFGLYLDGVFYDHERRTAFYFSHGDDRSDELPLDARPASGTPGAGFDVGEVRSSMDEDAFGGMVTKAKKYIRDGHVFQVVLSRAFRASYDGDPVAAYERLLAINPSPYMFYLKQGHDHLFGASPEMLLRVENGFVETDPIAGTRPLGATPAETMQYEKDLLGSDKERAEHAMLVDLARNDVGRVATPGSVKLDRWMRVERYSHVQHLVSRVRGKLAPGRDAQDALNALFPAGTVSGAPKVRAMEIIAELEDGPRGPYAGCVGYLAFNGNLDACITIRSVLARQGRLEYRSGAGIVADSTPEGEWDETGAKGQAMSAALTGEVARW